MSGCVFCDIVAGTEPAGVVGQTNDSIIFVPLSPVTDGHVLVVPRRHVENASTAVEVSARTMQDACNYAATRHPEFNIITSAGRAATQSIFHLHLHVVPRTTDDELMVPWGTVYGDNPADPHMCRELRNLGRAWNDGPRGDWEARVGAEFANLIDNVGDRVREMDEQ